MDLQQMKNEKWQMTDGKWMKRAPRSAENTITSLQHFLQLRS